MRLASRGVNHAGGISVKVGVGATRAAWRLKAYPMLALAEQITIHNKNNKVRIPGEMAMSRLVV